MQKYVLRRILLAIPTLLGVSILIFLALRVLPGDPLAAISGETGTSYILSGTELQAARKSLGLDKPYYVQYLDWMGDIARGRLGKSFWKPTPVSEIILRRGPITMQIALMAMAFSWFIGLPLGILSAVWWKNPVWWKTWCDAASRFLVILFMAVPSFWLGLMMIVLLVRIFNWRPPLGIVYLWDDPARNLKMTIGPALALGMGLSADTARITRSSVLEVLNRDYVRMARAKGLREGVVIWRHVLKNAMLPILTVSGLVLAFLLGGSVAVERAFSVPGLGLALVEAIQSRDWVVIQNLVLLYGVIFVVANLLVDISYGWFDPRIRYQ